jgi:murein DD-endopeptidase MepM/ murein hydrolase activator NlpD
MRPVRWARLSQPFADPGSYASNRDRHGPAGHHTGIDYGSEWEKRRIEGLPVRAARRGRVVLSEYNGDMGNWVGVYYPRGNVCVTYWHLKGRAVKDGQRVKRWTVLGRVGSTGNSTAPHLHLQVNKGHAFHYHGHIRPPKWVAYGRWEVRSLTNFMARRRRARRMRQRQRRR